MEIRLTAIIIECFKGIKVFDVRFNGNTTIKGENGSGKTTVIDALFWLWYDKDSTGRKQFEIHPLDAATKPIKGLVTRVEAEIVFGDKVHILRKELHEDIVKRQLTGYTTRCWVDEVSMPITRYRAWIAERIDEDTFKLLSDTGFFNDDKKFPWEKRRAVLREFAGDVGTPEGFEELIADMAGRAVKDYQKVLTDRKKLKTEERDKINTRVDENQKQLKAYASGDMTQWEKVRDTVNATIAQLDKDRQAIVDSETERTAKIDKLNGLKTKRTERETALKNDTSTIQKYIDERIEITKSIAAKTDGVMDARTAVRRKKADIDPIRDKIVTATEALQAVGVEYRIVLNADYSKTVCDKCNQTLPPIDIKQLESERPAKLKVIRKKGDEIQAEIQRYNADAAKCEAELAVLLEDVEKRNQELQEGIAYRQERTSRIESAIKNNVTPDPEKDPECQRLQSEITTLTAEIGEPAANQLTSIADTRQTKSDELDTIKKILAASDQIKKNGKRITELEEREKVLAQEIADIEKELETIRQYKKAESTLIETSVNDMFKHVKFKLFDTLLKLNSDGKQDTVDCCEATLNGVPYSDMSGGQKVFAGNDVINTLSEHHGLLVPRFIDNAESMTLPIEAKSQVIELHAVSGMKELIVE